MASVFCIGIAVLDYVYGVGVMPTTATKHRSTKLEVVGGGIAANAAVAVARLGGRALLATRLGPDVPGDAIRAAAGAGAGAATGAGAGAGVAATGSGFGCTTGAGWSGVMPLTIASWRGLTASNFFSRYSPSSDGPSAML